MKLSRRPATTAAGEPEPELEAEPVTPAVTAAKGRATPKRRDSQGQRGPVRAPQTRKEAVARQRQQVKDQKSARATAKPRSAAEQRAALRRGDPSALPRRDQGPTRKLARDYVDANRMLSNYLLWLLPLMILPIAVRGLADVQFVVLLAFLVLLGEWYRVGKKIRALAISRHGQAEGSAMTIGFYAGSRAYLPRKWRMPGPQVERGDAI